jgi:WD40 repeat protein
MIDALARTEYRRTALHRLGALAALFVLCIGSADSAIAARAARHAISDEPRTALLIGNSAYASSPLLNPSNDARDLAAVLEGVGFDVELLVDQNQKEMKLAIRAFRKRLKRKGGVGLFYYAGHGMEVGGQNYLIPVGADIPSETYVDVEAVPMREVTAGLADARNRMNIVILDACRNNPFARSWRSGSRGLAVMSAPAETLIAYATEPGNTAADGVGTRNSPYASALMESLQQPGVRLVDVFRRTRAKVKEQTAGGQVPWQSDNLTTEAFYFIPIQPSAPVIAAPSEAVISPSLKPAPVQQLAAVSPEASKGRRSATGWLTELSTVRSGDATDVVMSPDGTRIAVSGWSNTIKMFDASTGKISWESPPLEEGDIVLAVAFSPDGKRLISGSRDSRTLTIWDARNGTIYSTLRQNDNRFFGKKLHCDGVAFSPDGTKILTACFDSYGDESSLKMWNANGYELFKLDAYDGARIAFSPDSKSFTAGNMLRNARTGEAILLFERQQRWALAFSPDGSRIAMKGDANMIAIHDAKTGDELLILKETAEDVGEVAFSPDGRWIATSTYGFGSLRLWDAATGKELALKEGEELCPAVRCNVSSVGFSPDGTQLLTGLEDGTYKLWHVGRQ